MIRKEVKVKLWLRQLSLCTYGYWGIVLLQCFYLLCYTVKWNKVKWAVSRKSHFVAANPVTVLWKREKKNKCTKRTKLCVWRKSYLYTVSEWVWTFLENKWTFKLKKQASYWWVLLLNSVLPPARRWSCEVLRTHHCMGEDGWLQYARVSHHTKLNNMVWTAHNFWVSKEKWVDYRQHWTGFKEYIHVGCVSLCICTAFDQFSCLHTPSMLADLPPFNLPG